MTFIDGPGFEPTEVGNPAGWIANAIREGMSSRAALAEYRNEGFHIGNQRFRAIYNTVNASLDLQQRFIGNDPDAILGRNDLGEWVAGQGGKYAYQAIIYQRDRDTNLVLHTDYTVMSDVPLSMNQALNSALGDFAANADVTQSGGGAAIEGGRVVNGWYTIGWDDASSVA